MSRVVFASPRDVCARAAVYWRPVERLRPSTWAESNLRLPPGLSPKPGPYSFDFMPFLREPVDDWEDPDVREVTAMMGTRLGKTTMPLLLIGFTAAVDPGPTIVIGDTKPNIEELSADKMQRIFRESPVLAALMPPKHQILVTRFTTGAQTNYFAWSGSVGSLGARGARYLYCTEIDKWSRQRSPEADAHALAQERTKDYPTSKTFHECSPTLKNASRIAATWARSDRRHYHVPCPHCGQYQQLVFGGKAVPFGLKWVRGEDGHSAAPEAARANAWVVCVTCGGVITDAHKPGMLLAGKWVPEGQSVRRATREELEEGQLPGHLLQEVPADPSRTPCGDVGGPDAAGPAGIAGKSFVESPRDAIARGSLGGLDIVEAYDGTPLVMEGVADNPNARHHGYQLSSLYSPLLTFGDCAAKWLQSAGDFRQEQNFYNSWLAEVWEMGRLALAWQEAWDRTHDDRPAGLVPAEAELIGLACDPGGEKIANHYVIRAWDRFGGSWLIAEGQTPSLAEVGDLVRESRWPVAGTEDETRGIDLAVFDARYRKPDVEDLVLSLGPTARMFMGSGLKYGTWRWVAEEKSARTGKPLKGGFGHWALFSDYYQDKLDSMMHRPTGHPHRWRIHRDAGELYLKQLVSEILVESRDKRGRTVYKREVVEGSPGNHYRDCECYQIALWEMWLRGWARVLRSKAPAAGEAERSRRDRDERDRRGGRGRRGWNGEL